MPGGGEEAGGGNNSFLFIMLGLLAVMMIVPMFTNRKKQKQQQALISSIEVGTRVQTIGGLYGTVQFTDSSNRLVIDVGIEDNPTYITVDRNCIRTVLPNQNRSAIPMVKSGVEKSAEESNDEEKKD